MRLSGCPSLSVKMLDDPLRDDPVAAIDQSCVGCGNCGEVADAAVLCPSFYRADVIHNPSGWDRCLGAHARRRHRLAAAAPRAQAAEFRRRRPPEQCWRRAPATRSSSSRSWRSAGRAAASSPTGSSISPSGTAGMRSRPRCRAWRSAPAPRSTTSRWCPRAAGTPVLSLMPAPGDVDIVLAAELMEAGRAMQRGLVTPDRTTLIASTHRTLAVSEKVGAGQRHRRSRARCSTRRARASKRFLGADLERLAAENGSVISASLFGALAGAERAALRAREFRGDDRGGRQGRRGEPQGVSRRLRGGAACRRRRARQASTPSPGPAQGRAGDGSGPGSGDAAPGRRSIGTRRARISRKRRSRCCSPAWKRSSTSRTSRYGREYLDRLKQILHASTARRAASARLPLHASRPRNTSPTPWPMTT